ncbi:MAG TPA: APC family permease [Gemmatimonadales bacterium]|nr:APC family permease [Gemmatimonadales bacterium]
MTDIAATGAEEHPQLRRVMGFRDLLLFYLVTGFTVRWISTAAAAGPSSIVVWLMGCGAFYLPLMFTVLELSSRYPNEGGCYVWSKRAFGEFAGFITGWTYWTCNLPYFPGLFYFTASAALFLGGPSWRGLAASPLYFIGFSLIALGIAAGLNVRGLSIGKWLHNLGAVGLWVPGLLLLALGLLAFLRFGSATRFSPDTMPSTRLKDIVFWSTIAFSLSGLESASMLGGEIRDARRNIPRALLAAGVLITALYVLGTVAMLVALPQQQIQSLQGFMQAIESASSRLGLVWLVAPIAGLIVLGGLGQAGAWFAAGGRLPFVAGIDRYLPAAFGRLHPKYNSPYVSLMSQAGIAAVFIFLGQAGTTVKGAYDVLVSMSIISYFIPYLLMFASMIRLQGEPAGPEVIRVPGGRRVAIGLAALGFTTTVVTIGLALIPAEDDPNKLLAVSKTAGLTLLLVATGALVYAWGRRRRD